MTSKLRVTSLDYEDIKAAIVDHLKQQSEFSDHNFEASGLSVLIDTLAYNSHYQALMANFLANEMYLDTAVKRSSIVSRAKELGYTPYSKKAAQTTVNITVTNVPSPVPSSIILPVNTQFSTSINGKNYTFITLQSYAAQRQYINNAYSFTFSNVTLYEGVYVSNTFEYSSVNPTVNLSNVDIDTSTLRVFVTGTGSSPVEWSYAPNLLSLSATSTVYFLQEGPSGEYQVYFGDDSIGQAPANGSTITAVYLATSGELGNDAVNFTLASSVRDLIGATTSTTAISASSGGRARETSNSIRLNALSSYGTQNRAVTASDYKALISSSGVNVRSAHVWGGESNTPPKYGYIMVCAQPAIGDYVLESQKATIKALLLSKAVANLNIEFVDPEYLDISINTEVQYNKNVLDISTYDLETNVLSSIVSYADTETNKFDATFRYSIMMNYIDRTHDSILGNNTTFTIQKELTPVLYQKSSYVFTFNNSLDNSRKTAAVKSSLFTIDGYANYVFIEDDAAGRLHCYHSADGVKSIVKADVGTVNYATGDCNIASLMITGYDGFYLKMTALPVSNDIRGSNNTIVRIKSENVVVTSRAE